MFYERVITAHDVSTSRPWRIWWVNAFVLMRRLLDAGSSFLNTRSGREGHALRRCVCTPTVFKTKINISHTFFAVGRRASRLFARCATMRIQHTRPRLDRTVIVVIAGCSVAQKNNFNCVLHWVFKTCLLDKIHAMTFVLFFILQLFLFLFFMSTL